MALEEAEEAEELRLVAEPQDMAAMGLRVAEAEAEVACRAQVEDRAEAGPAAVSSSHLSSPRHGAMLRRRTMLAMRKPVRRRRSRARDQRERRAAIRA